MRRASEWIGRWQGVILSLVGVVATLWLAFTGRLGLYIHPRYFVFTVVLALVAAVVLVAAFVVLPRRGGGRDTESARDDTGQDTVEHPDPEAEHRDDDADHDEHEHEPRGTFTAIAGTLVIVAATVALLVAPPATLTTATASQRSVNSSAVGDVEPGLSTAQTAAAPGDYASFTVRDWATLLRQGASEQFLADKRANVSGFVTPDADDPENVFYVARFIVTCCAVDAQPVGVPIYQPGWQDEYAVDSWLEVEGGFGQNPSVTSAESIVLEPATVTPIEQPAMPYVY